MQSLVQKQVFSRRSTARSQRGFTLVELLVVIAIIGILMGIAVPAIFGVIGTAKSTKQRLEIGGIEQGVQAYQEKYGDYPPDFSDWTIVERHYRKIFPRIAATELNLLQRLLDVDPSNDLAVGAAAATHNPAAMDRAEAIVWSLGGYSSNPINPFTGDGGPLVSIAINTANGTQQFQVNVDRDNEFYEFDTTRMDLEIENKDDLISTSNYYKSSDADLFPHYAASDDGAPFVYFDSRTYDYGGIVSGSSFTQQLNGYANAAYGNVRPYMSTQRTGAGDAWTFLNPDTFQVIAPGIDSGFGALAFATAVPDPNSAVYFQYPTGKAVQLIRSVNSGVEARVWGLRDDVSRYQEPVALNLVDNFQQDNLTNFADGKLIDELQE